MVRKDAELSVAHRSGFSCTAVMKLLPTGTHASRRRCSTSSVSTLKKRLYGSSEKKPPPPLVLGTGALGGDGNADCTPPGTGWSGARKLVGGGG